MSQHAWTNLADAPQVATCLRCGLVRLTTIHNTFYFVQVSEPYLNCRFRSGDDQTCPTSPSS